VKQIRHESGFNPNARGSSGEVGIAQIMPQTAKGWGVDPTDPVASLNAAAQHMGTYSNDLGGDYAKALSAYNYGEWRTKNAIARCGLQYWQQCIPASTRSYIKVICGSSTCI